MQEKTELHLRYNLGTPQEKLITVFVDENRLNQIREIMEEDKVLLEEAFKRSEKIELHLTYDRGTPQEMRMTVYISQERADKILAIQKVKKLSLTEAYDQTEE